MGALQLIDAWPVEHVAAAAVVLDDRTSNVVVSQRGDTRRRYRLASISKPLAAWAMLVAVEEGLLALDTPLGQPGCTLRHLLSHAGGYPFEGAVPIAAPRTRRIYSNTGIEMAASAVAAAADMPFERYLAEAVFEPLGMTDSELRGSPAHAVWSTVDDCVQFIGEMMQPRLITNATASEATAPVFDELAGIVPGIGKYDHCSWGLGLEVKGDKHLHWTGHTNSPAAFGHFGGAGTLIWVDAGAVDGRTVGCVALTDRPFGEWAIEALRLWPQLSDAVLADAAQPTEASGPTEAGK
jgi:CubicO group peptidase (beta-lactamase class C family)